MTDRARKSSQVEEILAFNRAKKPKVNMSSIEQPKSKNDLVERVMDSLKLLSKKEEESKAVKSLKKKAVEETKVAKTDSDQQMARRRTNTFHSTTQVPLLDKSGLT